jgi:outer membrane receptor protein involved in Fe transport
LFYSNINFPDSAVATARGSYFSALTDDVNLLNLHAEMNGPISEKLSFIGVANINQYTLSKFAYAWNKPGWDAKLGLKYNLRDKIIAGMEISAEGKRHEITNGDFVPPTGPSVPAYVDPRVELLLPVHVNLNLSTEYRYSKILSFWIKLNNITNSRYYEWAFYPSQGLMFMLGIKYSL